MTAPREAATALQKHLSDPDVIGSRGSSESTNALSPSDASTIPRNLRGFLFHKRKSISVPEKTWGSLGLRLLYSPPDPLIDFIFVHGLRGGSVKTWQKTEDPRLFWPESWLPREPDLQNARIHTFGYNSDWGEKDTTSLDLYDFGRSLLSDMNTSPELRKHSQTPILLVGHSMGGLVIKKAYLLARQDGRTQDLADRIQCMFFLATPHHGSDSARLLNNILRASAVLSSKPYISDINKNSPALTTINDEFQHYLDRLQLWSFYETIKTKMGINSTMIVERDSATIGHMNENVTPLSADHRHVCKFDSPADPNYVSIRNSLVKATEDILGDIFKQKAEEMRIQIGVLESYMHITHYPADDLVAVESERTQGSCEWVTKLKSFETWRDTKDYSLLPYWLTGQAGAGKSVLATYIVRHLQGLGVDTCYYFFRHGQKAQQNISSFLCALAFQMALLHPSVRQVLASIRDAAVIFDRDDERAIWRKIFVNGILHIPIPTTQYWVIDGLDECLDSEKLFPFLQNFESNFPIRILVSSRRLPELEKAFIRFEPHLFRHHIDLDDTRQDIQRFVENNSGSLPVEPRNRPALIEKLVQKSDGVFLWIELVFETLEDVFSEEEVDAVLDQVPMGMAPLYKRILDTMAKNPRHTRLIQHILKWTVCSTRPLSILELQAALTHDLGSKILNVGKVVEELCGQLLRVDKNTNVHLVHATARDFLLSEDSESLFSMEKEETNRHLATVCLKYLIEDEMRPPRHPALISRKVQRSPLLDYACTSFSEHLASSSTTSDELFWLLDKFFCTNILSWVEYILSHKKNLYFLSRVSKNLQQYLDRRAKYVSPLNDRDSSMVKWQTDLLRIALKFGDNLLRDPQSIYFIVPPLCPSESSIHKQFGSPHKGLRLSGFTNQTWDDCICYIDYRQSRALSLAGCEDVFALGMKSGDVRLYKQLTCQEYASLRHGEPVKLLRFDTASRYLASAGFRQLKMWSIDGTLLWSVPHGGYPVTMAFTEDNEHLVTLNKHSGLVLWNAEDGTKMVDEYQGEGQESNPNLRSGKFQVVLSADICPNTELLAIAHRGRPPQIWNIEHDVMLSTCNLARDRPGVPIMSVSQVLFNPNAEVELLAVSYQDGELAIFDRWAEGGNEIKSLSADALTLAAASDGRTLATGDAVGTLKLWDFETLTLLYSIKSSEYEVRSLVFSGDCFRLYDIRDTKTKIWEPSVLVRKAVSEESSISESVTVPAPVMGRDDLVVDITCILAPPGTGAVLVGRDDGTVSSYDESSGEVAAALYSHRRDVFVTGISWNGSAITSADASSKVDVYSVRKLGGGAAGQAAGLAVGEKMLEVKFAEQIRGVLLHPAAPWLLVFHQRSSTLISVQTGAQYPLPVDEADNYRAWLWLSPQAGSVCLLGARGREMDIFYGLGQQQEAGQQGVGKPGVVWRLAMKGGSPVPLDVTHLASDKRGRYLAVQIDTTASDSEESKLLVYGTAHLANRTGSSSKGCEDQDIPTITEAQPILTIASQHIKSFLGFYGDRVVFLDHQLWVRSVDLSKTTSAAGAAVMAASSGSAARAMLDTLAERHFYIPRELVSASNGVEAVVTDAGTVVFPKEGELGVVKNAFEWSFKRPAVEATKDLGGASRQRGGRGGRGRR